VIILDVDRIQLRMSLEEKEKLKDKAKMAGLSVSEYVVLMNNKKKIYQLNDFKKVSYQIIMIGNNINQVVASMNKNKKYNQAQIDLLNKNLLDIKNLFLKIINEIQNQDEDKVLNKILSNLNDIKVFLNNYEENNNKINSIEDEI
jgi:hypothetical protein